MLVGVERARWTRAAHYGVLDPAAAAVAAVVRALKVAAGWAYLWRRRERRRLLVLPMASALKKRRVDGRSSGIRSRDWCSPASSGAYDPCGEARARRAASLGESSRQKHKSMIADYERFSGSRGVNPKVVSSVTAAHVANFYKKRLHDFELFESTAKAISAAMTVYFSELGCSGPWQTGVDADNRPTFSGHPNQSEDVKAVKRDHLKAIALKGHISMPVDPFEIGHAAAYYEEHIAGEASVNHQRLADLCLAQLSMALLLRFDEVTKIRCVGLGASRHSFSCWCQVAGLLQGHRAPDPLCGSP